MSTTQPMTPAELHRRLSSAGAPRMIDVRTPGEFDTEHIAGAYNVPLDLLREHREEIRSHLDDDVVLICRSGQRAGQAEVTLRNAGLANVHILQGGVIGWQQAGFDLNRGTPRWDLERQVRLVAGLIVASSVPLSLVVPGAQWVAFAIGAGLTFAAVTNTCAMGMLLAKLPYNRRGAVCDATTIIARLLEPAGRKVSGR